MLNCFLGFNFDLEFFMHILKTADFSTIIIFIQMHYWIAGSLVGMALIFELLNRFQLKIIHKKLHLLV